MAAKKTVKLHNRSDKPDNIILQEHEVASDCAKIEDQLPKFMRGYFAYLRGNVLPMTRLAYLTDIRFFCQYLIEQTGLTQAKTIRDITLKEFGEIMAVDVNMFIDYCRSYQVEKENEIILYENTNKTLARKKSSVSVLFKQLYRDGERA